MHSITKRGSWSVHALSTSPPCTAYNLGAHANFRAQLCQTILLTLAHALEKTARLSPSRLGRHGLARARMRFQAHFARVRVAPPHKTRLPGDLQIYSAYMSVRKHAAVLCSRQKSLYKRARCYVPPTMSQPVTWPMCTMP